MKPESLFEGRWLRLIAARDVTSIHFGFGPRMKISTRCRHVLVWLLLGCTEAIKVTVTLPAKEKKCFGEQAARMELLFVELSVADGSKVGVTVLSPHATIFSEHDRQQVKTAFTTQEAGPHWVCIQNDAPSAAEVLLTVLLGPEAKDYSQVAKKEHLEESQIALRRVEESLRNYHSNVLYIRAREERMRQTNDSTASRVIFFCLFNVFLMIGVGGWQMLYFKLCAVQLTGRGVASGERMLL
ncbi:Transmembrane emp24 domain-containing protein 10 [Symbiodinium microadriaticum]|uniref:Transmembrane emp24 domain-containing protein 10 n=1 Tax=Symbiodinium microadriaticum TaxID=2951 RepID=A0A1Q9CDF3_SYMMI|nr:Transmembrane emp24 domain-containing protein 10 [Symbiodinium microadriaticum]